MELKKISPYCYEIPRSGSMNVPGRIFMSGRMANELHEEEALKQVANVATLPGILKASMAMPDMHWGYGFPIGGVAAFDWDTGVISPGGVGYDINCGVRLAATGLEEKEIRPVVDRLVNALFQNIPSGVGSTGSVKLSPKEEIKVLREGSRWAVRQGFGEASDVERTEDGGCMADADPSVSVSGLWIGAPNSWARWAPETIFWKWAWSTRFSMKPAARAFGLFEGNQVTVLLHTGSRGLGYQVCDDSLAFMAKHVKTLDIQLPDRQLACAMIRSEAGRRYFAAMACAANYAWANRQILLHRARETFQQVLGIGPGTWPCIRCMISATTSPNGKHTWSTVKSEPSASTAKAPPGLSPGPPGRLRGLPPGGPADPDPRRHGHRLLCDWPAPRPPWKRASAPPATVPDGCSAARPPKSGARAAPSIVSWRTRASW
jgi:tRNA-splicing ligase RtcB